MTWEGMTLRGEEMGWAVRGRVYGREGMRSWERRGWNGMGGHEMG